MPKEFRNPRVVRLPLVDAPRARPYASRRMGLDGSRNVYEETEGGCMDRARPCYETGCRYHLGTHALGLADRDGESPTCSIDVSNGGPVTLQDIGRLMGFTRERVRQIEASALRKLRAINPELLDRMEEDSSYTEHYPTSRTQMRTWGGTFEDIL